MASVGLREPAAVAAAAAQMPDPPAHRSGLLSALAVVAIVVGLALLAAGQLALDETLQERFEKDPTLSWMRSPWLPRLAPGIAGLVLGGLIAGLGLRRFTSGADPRWEHPTPLASTRRWLGWTLIGVGAFLNLVLSVHVARAVNRPLPQGLMLIDFVYVRPIGYALVLTLGAVGCALLSARDGRPRLLFDLWDGAWIVGSMALYVALTAPFLNDPKWSVVGDEYSFLIVAYELASGRPFDIFWQSGVYGTYPLLSSFIQALTMRAFGYDIFGWKMGCVVMGALAIVPTARRQDE